MTNLQSRTSVGVGSDAQLALSTPTSSVSSPCSLSSVNCSVAVGRDS
jgi:hypothetical protein